MFHFISSFHTYNTRASTSEHFYTKESRVDVKRNVFRVLGSKFGMGYLKFLKKDRKAFKRSLKEMLLDFLETEDSYIDVDTIIVKMKK